MVDKWNGNIFCVTPAAVIINQTTLYLFNVIKYQSAEH